MTFSEIFAEYFSQYRGQANSIPGYGDREFTTAVYLCNSAIRAWDRADGTLWNELITTRVVGGTGGTNTITSGTTEYAAVTNMRKPPAKVRFYNGSGAYFDVKTIPPYDAQKYGDLSTIVWFEGGANSGYTLHIPEGLSQQYDGWSIDYVFVKKPTLLSTNSDPSATVLDMSDPNFAIQTMLSSRFKNSRNGFAFKISDREAAKALINMKIENSSGTYNNSDNLGVDTGWGVNTDGSIAL